MRKLLLGVVLLGASAHSSAAIVTYGLQEVRTSAVYDPRLPEPWTIPPERSGSFRFDTTRNILLSFEMDYGPLKYSWTGTDYSQTLSLSAAELFNNTTGRSCDLACFINSINNGSYTLTRIPYQVTLNFSGGFTGTIVGRGEPTWPSMASESGSLRVIESVPEPGTWALMLMGFGAIGFALRRQRGAIAIA